MAEGTHEIRAEIAETRERIAETAGAVGHKVDVPERVKATVTDATDTVKDRVSDVTDGVARAGSSARDALASGMQRTLESARNEPILAFLGGAAAGLMLGLALPVSRVEEEKLGPAGQRVKEKAAEFGEQALDRGAELTDRAMDRATAIVEDPGIPASGGPPETVEGLPAPSTSPDAPSSEGSRRTTTPATPPTPALPGGLVPPPAPNIIHK